MAECVYFNPNPYGNRIGDCVIRAICAVTGKDWDTTYTGVALQGYVLKDKSAIANFTEIIRKIR